MKKTAIIVAAGSGSRMNSELPKQFLLLKGKPVLYYSINSFLEAYKDLNIILVLPETYVATAQEILDGFFGYKKIQITVGGNTRFHSVQNGLKLISDECIVFVHDAARPFVSKNLIQCCYNAAIENGSAIPVIDCKDSVRMIIENGNESIDRKTIKLVQTPQTFHSKILIPAFKIDYKDKFTDEASVVEAFGLKLNLVQGEEQNIKITTSADLIIAETFLENKIIS